MKIRYIQSMSGNGENFVAKERDKDENWVWYDCEDNQAVRLIDAEIALCKDKADYEKAKENYASIEARKNEALVVADSVANLDQLKDDLKAKEEALEGLSVEVKDLTKKIKDAEEFLNPELAKETASNEVDNSENKSDEDKEKDRVALVNSFKADKNIVNGLKADLLKVLCQEFELEYTNGKTAKADLLALDLKPKE
jgi:vacuolar-type H+-ATPase subunit I/STV1